MKRFKIKNNEGMTFIIEGEQLPKDIPPEWGEDYTLTIDDLTIENAARRQRELNRLAKAEIMKTLKGKTLTALEIRQSMELLISLLTDEEINFADLLIQLAASNKK